MKQDCCNKSNIKKKAKAGVDMFIVWIMLVTIIIIGVVFYFGIKSSATLDITSDPEIIVFVNENNYDWGTIDIDGGIVSKTFTIENKGDAVLKIYNVKTSCMCTTAQLKTPETTSRKFGMHEKSSDVIEVKPSEKAKLIVEFDPIFHGPSGVGPITRVITMDTNSTKDSVLTFNLTGNVVKK